VVYEWLCGSLPFSGSFAELCTQHLFAPPPSLKEKVPALDPAIEQAVNRALAKDPKERFESISAFANALAVAAGIRRAPPTVPLPDRSPSASLSPSLPTQMSNGNASIDVFDRDAPMTEAEGSGELKISRSSPAPTGTSSRARGFIQQATSDTIRANYAIIDHPLTNGNPNALVMVAQSWNPGGGKGTYNKHPVGVWYDGARWAIFNQDLAAMTPQAFFNVLVLSQSSSVFVQVASARNSTDNYTVIDHPLTNGNPNAIVMVTQNWNPGGGKGTYNNHPVGVWYTPSGNWSIFNEDRAPMTPQVSFNVQVLEPSATAFVHQTTPANIGDNYTVFSNAATDGNPNALVLVTQNWNPPGNGNIYNGHEVGVWYTPSRKWSIFNEDYALMPLQSSFNVEIVQGNDAG
jgi:serine/threonine protein kinase